jgi:hypothetical protein
LIHFLHDSESDDYEEEDEEEDNRRVAFEGQYDAEEGRGTRGNSSSGGSVEVFDIMSSSEEEEEDEDPDKVPRADAVDNESSTEEQPTETEILNDAVDDYIGAPQPEVEEAPDEIDEGKILHENVAEYMPVSSPLKKTTPQEDLADVHEVVAKTLEDTAEATKITGEALMAGEQPPNEESSIDIDQPLGPQANSVVQAPAVYAVDHESNTESEAVDTESAAVVLNNKTVHEETEVNEDRVNPPATTSIEDEAYRSDAPYSSDGGNLGGSDVNADDEHESLDTEDDKRSLAEHGETFDEEEVGKIRFCG